MTDVPHFRVEVPQEVWGKLSTIRGQRFFLTLPGQEEVELKAVRGFSIHGHIDDATTIEVEMLATVEVLRGNEAG